MTRRRYCDLIEAVCRQSGIADWRPVAERGHLEVNGVPFTLVHTAGADDDRLLVYCDCGEPPGAGRERVQQRLLEVNLYLYGAGNPGFALNEETGHVLLMGQVLLPEATPRSLLATLGALTLCRERWRAGWFLGPEAGSVGARSQPAGRSPLAPAGMRAGR